MSGQNESEIELENTTKALRVFAEAGFPLARQRFAGDTFPQLMIHYQSIHRGGYKSRGESRYLRMGSLKLQSYRIWSCGGNVFV